MVLELVIFEVENPFTNFIVEFGYSTDSDRTKLSFCVRSKVSVGYVECPTQLRGSKRPQKDEGNGGKESCWQYDTMHGQHMVPWVELYPN